MEQFIDQKPLHIFTRQEFSQLKLPFPQVEERVGEFLHSGKKKKKPVFDATGFFEHLPLFTSTENLPSGWLTKGMAKLYNISISRQENFCGILKLPHSPEIRALYDKSNDDRFLLYKDLMQKEKEALTRDDLPFYTNETLPSNFLPICLLKGYIMSHEAEPVGIYQSKKEKKWMVLDMKKEMKKPHFSFSTIPQGLLTENEVKELKMEKEPTEMPAAYLDSYQDVIPLYDRRFHPKFKLRLLLGGTLHESL